MNDKDFFKIGGKCSNHGFGKKKLKLRFFSNGKGFTYWDWVCIFCNPK